MSDSGYVNALADPSLFAKDNGKILVAAFVDDFLLIGQPGCIKKEAELLGSHFRLGHTEEPLNDAMFTGVCIKKLPGEDGFMLDQCAYMDEVLARWGVTRPVTYPAHPELHKYDPSEPAVDTLGFQKAVGEIRYLADRTRPDLLFSLAVLGSYASHPTEDSWKYLRHLQSYILGTRDFGLLVRPTEKTGMRLFASADASLGTHYDGHSHIGGVVYLNGTPIVFMSKKVKGITLSTAEAELKALIKVAQRVMELRGILEDVTHRTVDDTPVIQQDNQSTLQLVRDGWGKSLESRVWRTNLAWMHELSTKGVVKPKYTPSEQVIADGFTKSLTGEAFHSWREAIHVVRVPTASPRALTCLKVGKLEGCDGRP